jgi:hypothetical protein
VLALTAGLLLCGVALGWYNYVRFANPLEFGRTYQLTSFSSNHGRSFFGLELNLGTAFRSAARFLCEVPNVDSKPPFLHPAVINPLLAHPGPVVWTESMIGAIPAAPIALLGLVLPFFLGTQNFLDEPSAWLLYVMYWSAMAIFCILCISGWILVRYLVDFVPLLSFGGIVVVVAAWTRISSPRLKQFCSLALVAVVLYGTVVNFALGMPSRALMAKLLAK